jgi:hypothetical protein
LCGHGLAFSEGVVDMVGGIDDVAILSSGMLAGVCVEDVREPSGVLFVGLGFTKSVINSGMFAGVTLSINCHDGSRSTMELWSEWSGMGMSDAESMSFWLSQHRY